MNYQNYIKQTYQLQASQNNSSVVAYFTDGTYQQVQLDTYVVDFSTLEELEYRVSNSVNRDYANYSTLMLVGFSYSSQSDIYFVSTNKLDFLWLTSSNSANNVRVSAVVDYNLASSIDDYNAISNYSTITAYDTFTSNGTPKVSDFDFTLSNGESVVFDYSNLYYENNGSYKQEIRYIRGENISYYIPYLYMENYEGDNIYLSYGAPYSDIANEEYDRGYGNGYSSGWVQGNQNGFDIGVSVGGNSNTANAFTYIQQTFNAVGGLLELEVLPHVTLGLCFSIPLVFVLIMTIFKLVRK